MPNIPSIIVLAFSLVLLSTLGLPIAAQPESNGLESPQLWREAKRELSLMRTSVYQHRTDVDEATGRFNYDCSGFLDYALQRIAPKAYAEIPISKTISKRPLAEDFYWLFSSATKTSSHWERISQASHLRAGDIVAWLRPMDNDSLNTGHVMLVRANPSVNPRQPDEILIPVIDSTTSPHAQDSRHEGQTGLGSGVIGVIVNNKSEPIAYHWRGGESKRQEETHIDFGRLR